MRANWRTGVVLESLVLAGLVGTQFVASAVVQDPSPAPARPRVQPSGHTSPAALNGQLLVKYKDSVTACVHCLLKLKRPFHSATVDHSDSLDRLHAKYQVTAATPIFRTEVEEEPLRGKALQVPLLKLQQHQQQHLDAVKAKFPDRTKRAPPGAVVPELSQVYLLALPEETDLEQAVWEFSHDPHVEYAQPNYLMEAAWLPNDPYYSSSGSWGQPTTRGDYDDLWALKKIQAESAWDLSQGQGVVVAVIDTGLDYTHPDLAANVWMNPGEIPNNGVDDDGNGFKDDTKGWDFTNCLRYDGASCTIPKCAERFTDPTKCEDNDPLDDNGHGTHVAGTIAAVGNNGVGIIGVAPQAKVMVVRSHNAQGIAGSFELARALDYAAKNGADVLNNSWACADPCPSNPTVELAVQTAYSLGAVVVFAAGNSHDDVAYYSPQNMTNPKPIVVSATTHDDLPASFTNTGWLVDLAAPGGGVQVAPPDIEPQRNILSLKAAGCNPTAANSLCPSSLLVGTNYLRQMGTSMAAPHAAGVAALVLARTPMFTNEEIRQLLRASADDIHSPDVDLETGAGRLNAAQALNIPAVPQVKITSPTLGVSLDQAAGAVTITGTASGSTFLQYELAYGGGAFPSIWTSLAGPRLTQVTDGNLGTWDIGMLADGTYTLRLTVRTADGFAFQERVSVSLARGPVAPLLSPIGAKTTLEGQLLAFTVSASDLNNESLLLSTDTLPTGASLIPLIDQPGQIATQFSWTPSFTQAGTYRVTFTVSDGSLSDHETVTITVLNDQDQDGFADSLETFLGTDLSNACAATTAVDDEPVDAWPPDFNDDRTVDGSDNFLFAERFGTQQGVPPPVGKLSYAPRFDLNADGAITDADRVIFEAYFGQCCDIDCDTDTDSLGHGDPFGLFFRNGVEGFLGTDSSKACAATPVADDEPVDAWPADFNDDQTVDGSDVFLFAERFGTQKDVPPPIGKKPYAPRFDLYPVDASKDTIDGSDVFVLAVYFGKSCTP